MMIVFDARPESMEARTARTVARVFCRNRSRKSRTLLVVFKLVGEWS